MNVLLNNPYDYNTIALKKNAAKAVKLNPAIEPLKNEYNFVGKHLGIVSDSQWNEYGDKVKHIIDWARAKAHKRFKKDNKEGVLNILRQIVPGMGGRRIDDYYTASKLDPVKEEDKLALEKANKPKVENKGFKGSEFDFTKKTKVNDLPMPTKDSMVFQPDYAAVAKAFGVLSSSDWSAEYDNVYLITEWAKEQTGLKDPQAIVDWLRNRIKSLSGFGTKPIDDLSSRIKSLN